MARTSPHRRDAGESRSDVDDGSRADDAGTDPAIWSEVGIDPVQIALPVGVGYTLRAYRDPTDVTPTDVTGRDEDDPFAVRGRPAPDEESVIFLDEEFAAVEDASGEAPGTATAGTAATDTPAAAADEDAGTGAPADEEEVPLFLSHRGALLLFRSAEGLAEFVRSDAPHDLRQLDSWPALVERIRPEDVRPSPEDTYELDLVVKNLRGGHDAWDLGLLISAGEIARDLAYALRLDQVLPMLAPGSPLDSLDEALRSAAGGGIGGFIGRRRLKKIGAQQASLGWRTVIGKISSAVDWRD